MEKNYELVHNEAECQYEYHIEGHLARLLYEDNNGVLHLTHTFVAEELSGRGIAGALVKDVLANIEKRSLKMKPACSYIVAYVEKHPEYERLL
ncbi:MAG: GNAT family N-acetyltransferase [Helicobacteraceae bacterium]|jgi:predicted GNAT family acetyltransferase|nr:GNAT family N-acetyltransferase [Helicobacteraceae bacterium]